ncbi:MAG: type II secretion system F family protein [Deltaproteobacteria bacterium]|nr:type II secretion system F family protein [Deltaproteobacteria bacterium]
MDDQPGNVFTQFLSVIGSKINPGRSKEDGNIKLKFLRAGLRGSNIPTIFWGTKVLLAIVLTMTFVVIVVIFSPAIKSSHLMMGIIFFVFMGLMLPDIWLRSKTARRKEKITKAFPDALDLLVVCVEAGMGLDAAISRVGNELELNHSVLSRELHLLNLELRAGKSRPIALRNLAYRTDIDDVNSLVTLLIQTDRFGTSVAQALRVYADTFRTTRFQRAEELAAKISTKLIFPLTVCIFPSFFVVVLGPAAIQMYRMLLQS